MKRQGARERAPHSRYGVINDSIGAKIRFARVTKKIPASASHSKANDKIGSDLTKRVQLPVE